MLKNVLVLALLAGTTSAFAQDSFNEALEKDPSKFIVRNHSRMQGPFDDGHGTIPNLKGKDVPKKIALVSFYTFDKGSVGKKSFRTPIYEYKVTSWTTEKGAQNLSNKFMFLALPKIASEFKKQGMELVGPDQYLTDESKKNAYSNFQPDISGFSKALLTEDDSYKSQAGVDGLLVKPVFAPFDFKTAISYGKLAQDLGVDAVMVVLNEVSNSDNEFRFDKLGIYVFGPNPVPKQDKKYIGFMGAGYNEGLLYEGEEFQTKGIPFIFTKGKKQGEYFEGYDRIAEKLAASTAMWLVNQTQGKDK